VGEIGRLGDHRRGGAVFRHRQLDRPRDLGGIDPPAPDDEVHVHAGEDPRLGLGPVGVEFDDDILDRLAALG
jgi:hypothetical protein